LVIEFREANPVEPRVSVDIATAYILAEETLVEYISLE
jgi:hypothetical protein